MIETKNVKILLDSKNAVTGDCITTVILKRFPRCLLSELLTHRVFSRNAESSRAIPVAKRIEKIKADPYIPTFTRNQKGMVGGVLAEDAEIIAFRYWESGLHYAIKTAINLEEIGIHKDMANRLLEPFARVPVIITATEWDNFFKLRTAPDCSPGFRAIAIELQEAMSQSVPQILRVGGWHIPFGDRLPDNTELQTRLKVSAARCARLSYATHDGVIDIDKDLGLCAGLISSGHGSPLEHQAKAGYGNFANFHGFSSFRWHIENNYEVFL